VEDLSLHILDIAENSIRADAGLVEIVITLDRDKDLLLIEVHDNGKGMDAETLARVRDPFFTTKRKKTGLGIPFLSQAAEQAGGSASVASAPGRGTTVRATFTWSHVDRPVVGNMVETLITLIAGHPDLDVRYSEHDNGRSYRFDTRELKAELGDVPISAPEAIQAVKNMLQEEIRIKG